MTKNLFFTVAFILTAFLAQAQVKSNAIKTNGLGIAIGLPNLAYERALNDKSSIQAAIAFASYSFVDSKFTGFGVTPEYRFYPASSKEAIEGFYFGPVLNYFNFKVKNETANAEASLSVFGGGAKFGWNWLLGSQDAFCIDLGLGFTYLSANTDVKTGNENDLNVDRVSGVLPLLGLSLGYAF